MTPVCKAFIVAVSLLIGMISQATTPPPMVLDWRDSNLRVSGAGDSAVDGIYKPGEQWGGNPLWNQNGDTSQMEIWYNGQWRMGTTGRYWYVNDEATPHEGPLQGKWRASDYGWDPVPTLSVACGAGCGTCRSSTVCTSCYSGYHLQNDVCQATTPAPTTVVATTPAPTTVQPGAHGFHQPRRASSKMDLQTMLLSFIYAVLSSSLVTQLWAIFVDHTWCCGGTGRLPSNLMSLPDATEDSSIVWHKTPPASRAKALACPGWAVATYILWFGLPWEYYRGCEVIICRGIAISCIIHQSWWWCACYNSIDRSATYQRDASVYLSSTLFSEIILGAAAAYVGFLSGPWNHFNMLNFFTFFDWVRVVVLLLLTGFATLSGIYASFKANELLILDTPKPPKNVLDAKSVWGSTPPGSKICALRANAWSMSFFWTATCAVFTMEPFLIRSVCLNISMAYVWFQLLYYFGMHGYIDDRRDYWDYLKWKTLKTDAIFFIMFSILGRIK